MDLPEPVDQNTATSLPDRICRTTSSWSPRKLYPKYCFILSCMCALLYGQLLLTSGLPLPAMPAGHLKGRCCELLAPLPFALFSFETADDEANADGGDCDCAWATKASISKSSNAESKSILVNDFRMTFK